MRGRLFVHERPTGITLRDIEFNGVAARVQSPGALGKRALRLLQLGRCEPLPGDTNGELDVFVHDRETGKTRRVSLGWADAKASS